MPLTILTPRLMIRELQPEDAAGMFEMDSDAEVHKYIGGRPQSNISEAAAVIDFVRKQYDEEGIGRWAVVLRDTGDFIGWTGFKRLRTPVNGHVDHLDFGYRHLRRYWRQGYAKEAARAALDHGLHQMGFSRETIYAMTDPANAGSRRILEGLGFVFKGIFPWDGDVLWRQGIDTTWYEMEGVKAT